MHVIRDQREVLRIDAPEWFAMDAFREAIERGTSPTTHRPLATFHRHGDQIDEYSDVFVLFETREHVEPDGSMRWVVESSDLLDDPGLESVYEQVAQTTRDLGIRAGILWITNVGLAPDRQNWS
jgi:hypothetical protein